MTSVFWRVINVLCVILSIACLLLQIFAILIGSWKGHDITISRFEPTLYNVFMYRKTGLFTSNIQIVLLDDNDIMNELLYISISNRHPMVTGSALKNCIVGPTLTQQISTCNMQHQYNDCKCEYLPHWTAVAVLELLSLPLCFLLVICSFMLRTHPQRFLRSITILICVLTGIIVLAGFILIFQYWGFEAMLLSRVLPYYIRSMLIQYYEMSFNELQGSLQPYDVYYISDNVHIYPGLSTFISLATLITLIILFFLLIISWILDLRQYGRIKRNRGPTGTRISSGNYKPIQQT